MLFLIILILHSDIAVQDDCYNIYSFLPRHEFDFPDEEEQSIIPL